MKIIRDSFFAILCLSLLVSFVSCSLTYDGMILLAVMKHWTSVPSSIRSSWKYTDQNPCSWIGVICEKGSLDFVASLNLSGRTISGSLGPEIGQLRHLRNLDLSNNNLSGTIPTELGKCASLEGINLSGNKFTGIIPDSLNPNGLISLTLSGNFLTGNIPKSLFQSAELESLYLDSNKLSGSIPDNIGSLKKIKALYLNNNDLSGTIPSSISDCFNLQKVDISFNKLTGGLDALGAIFRLIWVNVSHNNFKGAVPELLMGIFNSSPPLFSDNPELCVNCPARPGSSVCYPSKFKRCQ